jgi:phage anti-repressor protein
MNEMAVQEGRPPMKLLNGEKVDARNLWENLESKQQFSDWIKNRLGDFIEGSDYFIRLCNRSDGFLLEMWK